MAFQKNYIHRAVIKAEASPSGEAIPLSEWVSWAEARNVLLERGLAGYVFGIFVISPAAEIEMEIFY